MISDGNAKTCEASVKRLVAAVSPANIALLQRTHDGLHADDVEVDGVQATAHIGKTSTLRLGQVDGHWRVRSPNVVVSRS